jgi:hypothetical protein
MKSVIVAIFLPLLINCQSTAAPKKTAQLLPAMTDEFNFEGDYHRHQAASVPAGLSPITNEDAEDNHLLLASDPEFVSSYEREGFYPALSTNPQGLERMHVFNSEIMNSIKVFFRDYIAGSRSESLVPLPNLLRIVSLEVALTLEGHDCTEEKAGQLFEGSQELKLQLELTVKWLKKLLSNYVYTSQQMDENFLLLEDPASLTSYSNTRRIELRGAHNALTSQFLVSTRAARRQIATLQRQIINNAQYERMLSRGMEFRRTNPETIFVVSSTAGFITVGGVKQGGVKQSSCGKDKRDVTDETCPSIPVNVVLANLLAEVSPFRNNTGPNNSSAIKITVLDDHRLAQQRQLQHDDLIAQGIATGNLLRYVAVEETLHLLLTFWYHSSSSYYTTKISDIFATLDDSTQVAIKYLPSGKQSKYFNEMMHVIQEQIGLPGNWYNDFFKMWDDLKTAATVRKNHILANTF